MKKKEIEKIPYLAVKKIDSEKVKYVAAVAVKEVKNEPHLFLEIYENEEGSLETPTYRFVYTRKEWGNFRPEKGEWSACSITDNYCRQIWKMREKGADDVEGTYMAPGDIEKIKKFTGKKIWDEKRWWGFLEGLETDIKHSRWERSMQAREERLSARCEAVKELPEGFENWYREELFKNENYIYYKRKGRYATFWCSSCGKSYTRATKQKDTYEGQFETVARVPKAGQPARCEKCDAAGFYKPEGQAKKSVYGLKKMCYAGQKYKETGVVMRYIQVEKILTVGKPESFIVTELARDFFEADKKCITDYHLYSPYTCENEWHDHNVGYGGNIQEYAAAVYPGTYDELKGTIFQYSGLKEFHAQYEKVEAVRYLEEYQRMPQMEMLVKLKLYKLVKKMVENNYYSVAHIKNNQGKRLDEMLGIWSSRTTELIERNGDTDYLSVLQMEREFEERWTDEQIAWIEFLKINQGQMRRILQWMTVQKYVNRVKKYTGITSPEVCGAAAGRLMDVSNTYFDYLSMREQRGYDMKNTVYLFPRDLDTAHQKMVEEVNKEKLDKRLKEVSEKYPDIRKKYRRLRKRYYYEDENFLIRPAKSAEEIVWEGRTLHHCVGGDGYLSSHNKGKSIILMLRRTEKPQIPYITVEIEGDRIKQWYGLNDKKPEEKVMQEWLDKYLEKLKGNAVEERVLIQFAG